MKTYSEWIKEVRQSDLVRFHPEQFLENVAVRIWMDYGEELMSTEVFEASIKTIETATIEVSRDN